MVPEGLMLLLHLSLPMCTEHQTQHSTSPVGRYLFCSIMSARRECRGERPVWGPLAPQLPSCSPEQIPPKCSIYLTNLALP